LLLKYSVGADTFLVKRIFADSLAPPPPVGFISATRRYPVGCFHFAPSLRQKRLAYATSSGFPQHKGVEFAPRANSGAQRAKRVEPRHVITPDLFV
jgi:hypothetical protein